MEYIVPWMDTLMLQVVIFRMRSLLIFVLRRSLGKAGLLGGEIAPLLDNGLLHLSGVGSGSCAHLLGYINTLLGGFKLGDQLGHMGTGSLGL